MEEERLLDEVAKGVLWPEVTSEFLAAVPDGWAKVNGSWFRISEYEEPAEMHEDKTSVCCLPPVSLYELHDEDWSK